MDLLDGDVAEDIVEEILVSQDQEALYNENVSKALEDIKKAGILTEEDEKIVRKERKPRAKKDIPTANELQGMSDDEVVGAGVDTQSEDLYTEFASFIQVKTDIIEDIGIKETLPTGIDVLDAIMGGGFAIGALGMTIGAPGCGKSMLAIQTIAASQLKYKGKLLAGYLDSEEATTTVRMSNLGVRYPRIKPYTDITIEKLFKFLEGMCLYKETKGIIQDPSVIVWDSIANTLSEKEREAEDINSIIGYRGRLLSILIPRYVAKISNYNICLLSVNQLRDKIQIGPMVQAKDLAFMGQGKTFPGGNALKYNAFQIVDMRVKGVLDSEKMGFDGFACEVKCIKNKLATPNMKLTLIGNFVTGFDNFWTSYTFLVDNGRLVSGAWNYLKNLPHIKFRTKEAKIMYNSDPTFKEAFDKEIEESKWKEQEIN
jgi:RecA/RadA recombinase